MSERVCEREGCSNGLAERRAGAKFCSERCRYLDWAATSRPTDTTAAGGVSDPTSDSGSTLSPAESAAIGAQMRVAAVASLDDYVQHVDRYGPECVLETARFDLNARDLARLAAYLQSKERTEEWQRTRHGSTWTAGWVTRRLRPRVCACGCGVDLPASAGPRALYRSEQCRERARRERVAVAA